MNSDHPSGNQLPLRRMWASLPADGATLEWSLDPANGPIQGPLDLGLLRDRILALHLAEGQQALLVADQLLKAVYLEGVHYLEIGTGRGRIDPSGSLIFLAADGSLPLRWTREQPLRWGPEPHQNLIGSCTLRVGWPTRFFDTFIQGHETPDPAFIMRLIGQVVGAFFEERLAGSVGMNGTPTPSEIQTRLTHLEPEDLDEDLNPCGLGCTHLAVYTAAPPIDDERTTRENQGLKLVH